MGAWHLERYDTALKLMRTLRAYQDERSGGAYVERPEARGTKRQDLLCTSQLGMAALTTGDRAVADQACGWVKGLWQAQPDMPARLFTSWDDDGLMTSFPDDMAFHQVVEFQRPRQAFFNPGIGAAFLARYHMVTVDEESLTIADELLALTEGGTAEQYEYADTVHVGTFAWGAAAVLDLDGGERQRANLRHMAQWFCNSQLPDGRWNPSAFLFPEPNDADVLWKTAEHVMIMTLMIAALASRRS